MLASNSVILVFYPIKMANKRELVGLRSELGGYWGEEEPVKKAKKDKANKKTAAKKKSTTSTASGKTSNPLPAYTIPQKTHKEAGFYGGDIARDFVPKNELGDKVDKFLYRVFMEVDECHMYAYASGIYMEDIENAGNDDIDSFFVPLGQSFMGSLSWWQGGVGTVTSGMEEGLKNKEGSAVEQMKAFSKWYADNDYYGYRLEKLDWLIMQLEKKKAQKANRSRSSLL